MIELEQQDVRARVRPGVTLSDNYNRLTNKPTINGVTLQGNMTPAQLNLLDSRLSGYKEITLGADTRDSFLLALDQEEPAKIKIGELTKGTFSTVNDVTEDMQIGTYAFKKMEDR